MASVAERLTNEQRERFLKMIDVPKEVTGWEAKLKLSDHAEQQAKERFNLSPAHALGFFRDAVRQGTFIGETVCEENGNRCLAYGCTPGIFVLVSPDRKIVITVIKLVHNGRQLPDWLRPKFVDIYKKELRKLYRDEKRWLSRIDLVRAEAHATIWNNKLLLLKTSSEKKAVRAKEEIEQAEQRMINAITEIEELQSKIRQTAKSLTSML